MSAKKKLISDNNFYKACADTFEEITKQSTHFLQSDDNFCNEIKNNLKNLYDFLKREESQQNKFGALPELVVDNFDLEQIWQQVELQNDAVITPSLIAVTKLVVNKFGLLFEGTATSDGEKGNDVLSDGEKDDDVTSDYDSEKQSDEEEKEDVDNNSDKSEDDNDDDDNMEEEQTSNTTSKSVKPSVVDDEFFKLSEMEKFLENEEKKLNNPEKKVDSDESESEESVDLFEGSSDDDEDEGKFAKYKDFFTPQDDKKKSQHSKHIQESSDEEDDDNEELLQSTLELKQHRLNKKIEEIEDEAIKEKSWQLKGEITADKRPHNSLLEEVVEFDLTSRPAPVITEQTTMQLEDIIKQRIKDRTFDSVERKFKPTETPLEYKKKLVLDQEKSKESLAQIYEKEFLQQQALLSQDDAETDKAEPELHKEINSLMTSLFTKLDALSNFHFTPKPAIPELKIISNVSAINMEEIAPVATSDAALLAPEEIKSKTKGDMIGKNERTATDKKRERRKKKLKQKIHAKEKQKKEASMKAKPGFGKKSAKNQIQKIKGRNIDRGEISADADALKSSKAFFTQLQDQVKSEIKKKSPIHKANKSGPTAKRLKL